MRRARYSVLSPSGLSAWVVAMVLALGVGTTVLAQEIAPVEGAAPPATEATRTRTVLRFLTDSDYPPFNYLDEEGNLTGFNIDVARAICLELDLTCDVGPAEWHALLPALGRGETDAVIASIAITPQSLAEADFTTRYYAMPGRFATRKDAPKREVGPEGLEARRIGVVQATTHEAYLHAFFRDSIIVPFETTEAAREALRSGAIEALFDDGLSLVFWLSGTLSAGCCEFRGGAFTDERYFGEGVGIAVRKGDLDMRKLIDKALAAMRGSGRLDELFLRYFPIRAY